MAKVWENALRAMAFAICAVAATGCFQSGTGVRKSQTVRPSPTASPKPKSPTPGTTTTTLPGSTTTTTTTTTVTTTTVPGAPASVLSSQIKRQGESFAIPSTGSGNRLHPTVQWDAAHNVNVIVQGRGDISGAFVSADGAPVGSPFMIDSTSGWVEGPTLCMDSATGKSLAAWHDLRAGGTAMNVYGRIFQYSGGSAQFLTNDFAINTSTISDQRGPVSCAFSSQSQEFLVIWAVNQGTTGVYGQRVSINGSLIGGAIPLMTPDWYEFVEVAYNRDRNEFVAVSGHCNSGCGGKIQRLSSTGSPLGAPVIFDNDGNDNGIASTQITWNRLEQEYMLTWLKGATMKGMRLNSEAQPTGSAFQITTGAFQWATLAHNIVTNTYFTVFHGDTAEVFGTEFTHSGNSGSKIQVTTSPAGAQGNYTPGIAANPTRREWMVVSGLNYLTLQAQRLLSIQ